MNAGRIRQIILTVAGIFAVVTMSSAQGSGGGPGAGLGPMMNRPPMQRAFGPMGTGGRGWWNNPRMIEQLKLTDDQRKAMDAILLEHREKLIDLRANLEKAELTMEPMMSADPPNDAAITAQIDKVVAARAELERANARFLLAIRDKLTADQWKQIQAARMDRGPRWRDRPGMRRQMPQNQQPAPPPPPSTPGTGPGTGMEQ